MLAATTKRVPNHTAPEVNACIRRDTELRLAYYAVHPEEIDGRLEELDREWDIERALETTAASVGLMGFLMAMTGSRKWLALPAIASGFLLQHALQGWCPPLSLLRRKGVRTQSEIELERYALRAMRGDFEESGRGYRDPSVRASELASGT